MIEALAIGLPGADASGMTPRSGALVLCIRADLFRTAEEQVAAAEALRARLHDSGEVLAPGELERRGRTSAGHVEVGEDVLALLEATS